jgi:O-antigen ligase
VNYLVELGIIGCALFILIFLKIFHITWNFLKSTPDLWEKKLYIGYIAGLVGYTSAMLFVNIHAPRPIFWFYTAVLLRYGQLKEIGEDKNDYAFAGIKKDTTM